MKRFHLILMVLTSALLLIGGCGKKDPRPVKLTLSGPPGTTVRCQGQMFQGESIRLQLPEGRYLFNAVAPGYRECFLLQDLTAGVKKITLPLQPVQGAALIMSNPAGANVLRKGEPLGRTPVVLRDLPPGEQSVQVELPGYASRTLNWTVVDERPLQLLAELESNSGRIQLNSNPAGASVFVNGKQEGQTPVVIEKPEGRYLIRIEFAGYQPEQKSVSLPRGGVSDLSFQLKQYPGSLQVVTEPAGAEVFVGDVRMGNTPCRLENLTPGKMTLRITMTGFDPVEEQINLFGGDNGTRTWTLSSNSARATLHVRPAGVSVLVDGKPVGRTVPALDNDYDTKPIVVENLSPGRHVVVLSHPRANPPQRKHFIVVEKGKELRTSLPEVWIANCKIRFRIDGHEQIGVLYGETGDKILFGPQPGVKFEIDRNKLSAIEKLDISPEEKK